MKIKQTNYRWLVVVFCIAACITVAPVNAQWTGGLEGGTVFRDGGNATRLRVKLENRVRPLSHYLYADWIRGGGDNSYQAGYLPRYWFDDNRYLFGEASTLVDRALSIDQQHQFTIGAGYLFKPNRNSALRFEAGLGHQQTEFVGETEADDTFTILRAAFNQSLAKLVRFELDVDAVSGEALSRVTAEASIAVRIPSGAVKFSYRARRVNPDGAESIEDEDSFVSFSYGF